MQLLVDIPRNDYYLWCLKNVEDFPLKRLDMNKNLLLLICTIFFSATLVAQDVVVTINPTPSETNGEASETDIVCKAEITNETSEEITIRWERVNVNTPNGWTTWVCDKNLCYTPQVGETPQSQPVILAPGETGVLDMHANPAGIEGEGTAELLITPFDDPTEILETAMYKWTVETTVDVDEVSLEAIKVFPNPTTDLFALTETEGVSSLAVYSLLGRQVLQATVMPGRHYDISNLSKGLYLVTLFDQDQQRLKTVRLNKQ